MTPEMLSIFGAVLAFIYRRTFEKSLTRWFIKFAARLPWNKKKAALHRDEQKDSDVDELISDLGNSRKFNRVTVSEYVFPTTLPVTLEDYQAGELSIVNEWKQNADSIFKVFQNVSCDVFGWDLKALCESKTGYIVIPGTVGGNGNLLQNLYGVCYSVRFLIGPDIRSGVLSVSFTHKEYKSLDEVDLQDIKNFCVRLHVVKNKKPKQDEND